MEVILYIFVVIFFLLAIGFVYTLIKDFKEIVRGIVNSCKPQLFYPITWVLSPIWLIGKMVDFIFGLEIIDKSNDYESHRPEKYSSKKNLSMDFINGDKIIVSGTSVSKTRNYDRSNRIYLTLDLNLNEVIIQNLKNFKKITKNEILDEFGYDLLEDNENKAKEFLSEKIIRNDTDLIISNAICNLSDILSIEKFINSANKSIDRVYIPSIERRKKSLLKSQEDYRNHSRWIDEPPGRLEELYEEFTHTLEQLKIGLEKTNIEVVEI